MNISNITVTTRRVLVRTTEDDEKPIDKEPQSPTGYKYFSSVEYNETTKKFEVIRRLKPIKDHPEPLNGEPTLLPGYRYETCQDLDNPQYNVDGQRILKFFRRIVKINSEEPEKGEEPAPTGYTYRTVGMIDRKVTKTVKEP